MFLLSYHIYKARRLKRGRICTSVAYGYKNLKSLKHLAAEFLGADTQNGELREHCPIDDARATMLFYQKKEKRVREKCEKTRHG
ncbi:unnamed protein product [Brassica rapa subsp. narinosa]